MKEMRNIHKLRSISLKFGNKERKNLGDLGVAGKIILILNKRTVLLGTYFLLVYCLAYSSTQKMENFPPKHLLTFIGLQGVIPQKT